jgi:ABC-2 type transport system ATP-binding protein
MADDLIVIGRGHLIEQGPLDGFVDQHAARWVRVRTPDTDAFVAQVRRIGGRCEPVGPDSLDVHDLTIERLGELARDLRLLLHELSPQRVTLEEAFLNATAAEQDHRSAPVAAVVGSQRVAGA